MKKGEAKLHQIYNFLLQFSDEYGYPPSVREIAKHMDIKSTSTVQYYLDKLKESGLVQHKEKQKRALVVAGKSRGQAVFAPLVGRVSAGQGMLAVENLEGEYPLPKLIFSGDNLYLLRVEGNSMENVGIDDGDFVVIHKQENVEIGEIAVVIWEEKATIKRIVATTPCLVLHPENDSMTDIVIPPEDAPIVVGKVVGCIKKF